MARDILSFQDIDTTRMPQVGGKGAHLGELSRIEGVHVPPGFCVTTGAFARIVAPRLATWLERLARLKADDREAIRALSADIRQAIEAIPIPHDLAADIRRALAGIGENSTYAVRSSATAEDLPGASFAGQHDSWLNVAGSAAVLTHVSRCWASLFTERAVTYRLRNGVDQHTVHMAVVVQRMVAADAAGILFTADPVTGHRKVAVVEAAAGLGEALVSGTVNADVYRLRDGAIAGRTIQREQPVLTDEQALRLAQLGRRIEAHFGRPQDIEWCLADDDIRIVQSRPITTLFPIPAVPDADMHIYLSVGHQQMMTDAMKPLGLSLWQLTTPRPMGEAGGRLFVDVTQVLAAPASRAALLDLVRKADPLLRDAIDSILSRDDTTPARPDDGPAWTTPGLGAETIPADPAIPAGFIERTRASIAALQRDIATQSGPALFDFILADIQELRRILHDPRSTQAIMAGMNAAWWLNEKLLEWLGEKNAADVLTQSVPNNVTSEMGLALLDVADAIRPHPAVVSFLQQVTGNDFLDALPSIAGGREARDAIRHWLDTYGVRGPGEIDITRPRWSERPALLLPLLLGHVKNFEPGAATRRFEEGRQEAEKKTAELQERLRALPDGEAKAVETKWMIDRVRTFAGYREYPKFGMIARYFIYKQALLREADRLVRDGVVREREDIFYLRFDELHVVARTNAADQQLIQQRKDAFASYQSLTPPRVLTSDGEAIAGAWRRDDVPAGALVGLPVSAGTVEGRARVVLDMADAKLEPGDILVTAYTDPSWTPLFVAIAGLVTEIGGLMTHGSVIAREYGLPAVVGVEHATRLIQDGQRIRVHGTEGYVEILPAS